MTSFDHADIYGDYSCEEHFGEVLKMDPNMRSQIQLITKCGIKLLSDKYPERQIKHYDYSHDHIISSVEKSLTNLATDHIDLLLLHRPAPFFDPNEVAKAFTELRESGKVLHFGVSNFNSVQFEMLSEYLDFTLATNQVEISVYCLEHFENSNIDFLLKEKIPPMAWSPLGGGRLFDSEDPKGARIARTLNSLKEKYDTGIDTLAYAWLLSHPATILPIIGTGKLDRLKTAVQATNVQMALEDWYDVYTSSLGEELP